MLPDALHTLRSVADHYATGTAKEAYGIAVLLVNQQRERRLLLHVLGYHLKVNRTLPVSSLTIWWQGMNLATTNQIQTSGNAIISHPLLAASAINRPVFFPFG